MASNTKASENKRKRNHRNAGHRRKALQSKNSTPSYAAQFAGCGEPGKTVAAAAGKTVAAAAAKSAAK
ncbi:MAG: hypothetical protein EXR73_14780 [Myxococcales bacterium]|nr:hypothetical protein [Myxococcales bacterium]